ncbi:hypothetical protein [uncultured Desulfovibrio sp.]|nr:hypothetical protein [uncultured Desulfovibrio sp.]
MQTTSLTDILLQADFAVQLAIGSLLFSLLFSLWGLLRLKLRSGGKR